MDLRNLRAVLALSARADGSRQGVNWAPVLGVDERIEWEFAADEVPVMYSVLLSGITADVNPILDLLSGAVTADGATVDGAGKDYQGNPLPTMTGVVAIVFERLDADPVRVVAEDGGSGASEWHLGAENVAIHVTRDAETPRLADSVTSLTFTASGVPGVTVQVRLTVLAKGDA